MRFYDELVVTRVQADPASPIVGQIWYNESDAALRYRNATETVNLLQNPPPEVEATQDLVGAMLTGTATIGLTYDDAAGTLYGTVLDSPLLEGQTLAQVRAGIDAALLNGRTGAQIQSDTVAQIVDTSPATLDTLNELAAALGDDPNFATTITNLVATKADTYAQTFGDGLATTFTITHGLGSLDVVLAIKRATAPHWAVQMDWRPVTENTVEIKVLGLPPAANEFRCTIIGG